MSANKKDYDEIAKDHLRMRLQETGWTDTLTQMVKNSVTKRLKNGQTIKSIKFEQLYKDVIIKARDSLPSELEVEFHEKYSEYLSSRLDETNMASSSSVQNVPSDIPKDVISNNGDDEIKPYC